MKLTRENVGEYIKEFKEKNKDIIKKSIKDDKKKHNQIARHVLKQAKEDLKLALKRVSSFSICCCEYSGPR